VERFWERPYGLKFAVGIEDTFIPQTSPDLRSLNEYGMNDLEPDGGGGFLRIETPVVSAFRTAAGRTSKR
jgi:hypothetical protein